MEIGILGPLVVRRDGVEIVIGAPKQRALLTLLALRRGEVVTTDRLVDELWGGEAPATAVKIVQGYVSQLRRLMGDAVLQTRPRGYLLHLTPDEFDATRFERLVAEGRAALAAGDPGASSVTLQVALALWRGPPLEEFRFEVFAAAEIPRLEEVHLLALEHRLDAELALGHHAAAIPELQALVREHPLRENLRRLLMLALYRAGRQADALGAYQDARKALVDELGIDPGEELRELEAAILTHDPALNPHRPSRPVSTPPSPSSEPLAPSRTSRRRSVRLVSAATAALVAAGFVVLLPGSGKAGQHSTALPVDSVGFIDSHSDRVTNQISFTGDPTAMAVGANAVWIVDTAAGTVSRLDPGSHSVLQTIPIGLDPSDVVTGGGGVWVANHDDNTVSWISPESNAVVRTIPVGAGPVALAYGFGAVWVTNGDDRTLTRIDAATGRVVGIIPTNAVGRDVTVGGGLVWVTDEATNKLLGVDPARNAVVSSTTVGTGPTAVAYGAGSVWVVNALDGTVSRVDATTLAVVATIPVPGGPSAVSFAPGVVWVSAEFGSRVVRIDPVRGAVTASIPIGNQPVAAVASADGVWVAVQPSGAGHRGGRLVVIGGSVDSIDPAAGDIFPAVADTAYDGLTALRHIGGVAGSQLVPDLAQALPQPTDGGRSYTFRLRPGIRYSDGRTVQAGDFLRALQRVLVLGVGFPTSYAHIVGASACTSATPCDLSRGVLVGGPDTITFRLTAPDSRLFEELTYLVPVPPDTSAQDVGTTPVPSTGPYAIQAFARGKLLTFDRNRYFHVWSAAARPDGFPDEIVYRISNDENAALREVVAGRADITNLETSSPALDQLAGRHPRQVHVEDQQSLIFLFLNVDRPPFKDVRVRRALNYAVDRSYAARLFGATLARISCQVVPDADTGYRPYCPYTIEPSASGRWVAPDLARARSLVAASHTAGQSVVLWSFADFKPEAQYLVGVLDALGYDAQLHEVADPGQYFDELARTPSAQAGMFGWFGTPLAVDMFATLACGAEVNPAHFCNTDIDGEVATLATSEPVDPTGTADLAARVDREITDLAPWVPLFTPRFVDVTAPRVGNFKAQNLQVLLDQLWVR